MYPTLLASALASRKRAAAARHVVTCADLAGANFHQPGNVRLPWAELIRTLQQKCLKYDLLLCTCVQFAGVWLKQAGACTDTIIDVGMRSMWRPLLVACIFDFQLVESTDRDDAVYRYCKFPLWIVKSACWSTDAKMHLMCLHIPCRVTGAAGKEAIALSRRYSICRSPDLKQILTKVPFMHISTICGHLGNNRYMSAWENHQTCARLPNHKTCSFTRQQHYNKFVSSS